jgi:hypothetical protein
MTKKLFTDAFVLGVADWPQSDGSGSPDGSRERPSRNRPRTGRASLAYAVFRRAGASSLPARDSDVLVVSDRPQLLAFSWAAALLSHTSGAPDYFALRGEFITYRKF